MERKKKHIHTSLYPNNLLSNPKSATAHAHARPASPVHKLAGSSLFSNIPSFSNALISWPVVKLRKCSNSSGSRASAFPEMPWQRQASLVSRPRSRIHSRPRWIARSILRSSFGKYFLIERREITTPGAPWHTIDWISFQCLVQKEGK